jgi:hypothetical protein
VIRRLLPLLALLRASASALASQGTGSLVGQASGTGVTLSPRVRGLTAVGIVIARIVGGDYLLTFRALTRSWRVTSTSRSIRFSLTSAGRLTRARLTK